MAPYAVLIAEGDPDIIQHLSGNLRANGFTTTGTSSGANAFDLYKKDTPDLVVADLDATELDGLGLLEELRRYDPNARVIITTEAASKEIIARAFRLGALDVLEKPLEPEFLITKIRELLAREDRALEGNLQMMSLASIIQINCEERNQAELNLNHLGRDGRIYFKEGEMIHAEFAGLAGEEAVYALLGWETGTFQLKMGREPRQRTINMPWSGILLEGMRRIDESEAGWVSDWDEEDQEEPEIQAPSLDERIVKALGSLRDVEGALICNLDGDRIAQAGELDAEGASQLGQLIYDQSSLIQGFLAGGGLERAVLTGQNQRFYLEKRADRLILLTLNIKSSAVSVSESVETVYKRYQQ